MHSSYSSLCVLLGIGLAFSGVAWARPQPVGSEFQVNTYTSGKQGAADVATDADGNFVVVWTSSQLGGGSWDVFGQRYDSTGTPQGSEFQLNTYTTGRQLIPVVAATAGRGFVTVWYGSGESGSGTDIFGQLYDGAGVPQGSNFRANTYTTSDQEDPAIAADADGSFVVVWTDTSGQDGDRWGVFGQRFDSAGTATGSEFQVNTYTTSVQEDPAIAADADGNFVVVWESSSQDGDSLGVFGQRFDSAGTATGSEFLVNTYTTSVQEDPAIAADADGNFVVVWESSSQDGDSLGVFGQRFDSAGTATGSEFQVNTYTTLNQGSPAVASDADGNFVVVWTDLSEQSSFTGSTFGQRYDSTGMPQGSEFQVNTSYPLFQLYPAVASDADGDFVVVWNDWIHQDGNFLGVFGRRFDSAGVAQGSAFQVNTYTTSDQQHPAIAADADGNFVVVWTDYSGQDGDISGVFGQRFQPHCATAPAAGCVGTGKGIVLIKEKAPGREKLKVVLKRLKSAVDQSQFGDPVVGATGYNVCIYDDTNKLVGVMVVDRAQDDCGTPPRPCWRAISDRGYKYNDRDATADGIQKIIAKGGVAGQGKLIVKGKNNSSKGQTSLPTGIAAALQDNSKATVQIATSDADCFGFTATQVKKADGLLFKAIGEGSPSAAFLDVTSGVLD